MASKIGSGANLQPGATHVWWWNNYVFDKVYTFAAHPIADALHHSETQAQVISVKYVVFPHHDAPSSDHIEIVVSNPGSAATSYDLFMTFA